jgi:hypothetical protein
MSLTYQNPTAIVTLTAPEGVSRNSTQGNSFSVSMVGGYQEVYYLESLKLTFSGTGLQTLSANTIPIQINIGTNTGLSYTKLTLNNDNISSGRRKLGMLAYIQETDNVYQYTIPNYDVLWSDATGQTGSASVYFGTTYTEVNARSQAGKDFISAWTGSTIEGVSGVTRENARWRIFQGTDIQITGGTYYSGITTLDLFNNTGGTITITGFTGTVTGGTYNSGTGTLTLNSSDTSSFDVTGFTGGGSVNVVPNSGLGIVSGNTLFTTYNTLLEPALAMPYDVGGIPAGTTVTDLSGDTFVSLFNDLLFPTVQPTYTIPTISMGGVANTLAEVGSTISLSLTATGVKNDAGIYTQLRVLRDSVAQFTDTTLTSGSTTNIPDQFGYADPNNPNISFTISPTPYSEVYTLPAPTGLNTSTSTLYNADGNYLSGTTKQDSKGGYDVRTPQVRSSNAPQAASNNFNSTTYTYTNIYPYFYGTSSSQPTASGIASIISGGTATKVLLSASGDIRMDFNTTTEYLWVAVFSNYTNKTLWYVNDLNKGAIGGLTNLYGTPINQLVNSPNGYWSGINFEIYISNYQTTNDTMYLKNS